MCIASIVRVWYLSRLVTTDSTWTTVDPTNWSTIEICLGIVSACLPIMRSLLRHALNVRLSVHIGSRQSTKLREISNSHGSKNGGSGHHAASAGRNLNIASPGNGMVPLSSRTSNTADWPGYSQHHSSYKTTLDRDLVSQSHARGGSNEPRLPSKSASRGGWSTYNGPFNPAHNKNRSEETGLTTEIMPGDSSGRGSATSDADDLIDRMEEKLTKGFRRGPSKAKSLSERDVEQATLASPRRGGIKVEKVMEWSEEKRGLPS